MECRELQRAAQFSSDVTENLLGPLIMKGGDEVIKIDPRTQSPKRAGVLRFREFNPGF